MFSYDNLLVVMPLLFCGYASYTDLKSGVIKNSCTFGLLYAGLLIQLSFFIIGRTTFSFCLSIITVSGLIAFACYWFGVLSPGDAKLYYGISLALPPSLFVQTSMRFPPIIVLANIFIVYFSFGLIYILLRTSFKQKKEALAMTFLAEGFKKNTFDFSMNLLFFSAFAYCVYYLFFLASNLFSIPLNGLHTLVLVIFVFFAFKRLIKKYEKKKYWAFIIMLPSLLALGYFHPGLLTLFVSRFVTLLVAFFFVYSVLKAFVLHLDRIALSKWVDITELRQGMIPAEQIKRVFHQQDGVRYEKEETVMSNLLDENIVVSPVPEGISEEKITELQQLAAEGHFHSFDNKLLIQHTFHFAPIILLGTLLTIVCKGPFYAILARFI